VQFWIEIFSLANIEVFLVHYVWHTFWVLSRFSVLFENARWISVSVCLLSISVDRRMSVTDFMQQLLFYELFPIIPAFYGTSTLTYGSPPLVPVLRQMNPIHFSHSAIQHNFNIILPSAPGSSQRYAFYSQILCVHKFYTFLAYLILPSFISSYG
jgi:hypothetical protein